MNSSRLGIIAIATICFTGSLVLAGCSSVPTQPSNSAATVAAPSATASPSAHGALAACSLITEQEAGAALGTDPGPGVADTQGIATSCSFGTPPSILTVNLVPDAGGKVGYEHALGLAQAHPLVMISGVGDAAFGTFEGTFGTIEFYKGDALVNIVLGTQDGSPASKDKVTVLAKLAAGRM